MPADMRSARFPLSGSYVTMLDHATIAHTTSDESMSVSCCVRLCELVCADCKCRSLPQRMGGGRWGVPYVYMYQ